MSDNKFINWEGYSSQFFLDHCVQEEVKDD